MSEQVHDYAVTVEWTGNRGEGTRAYDGYDRAHVVAADGPAPIDASSDPAFRGDPGRWNPEQLFLAALSQCHMLWYLHLAQRAGIVVTGYRDDATATMQTDASGGGEFTGVVLHPEVTISAGDEAEATRLHDDVGDYCFVARSVRVSVDHEPRTVVG